MKTAELINCRYIPPLAVLVFLALVPSGISAAVTVAFGAVKNESGNFRLNELEFRLPIEIIKLMKEREKDVKVMPPQQSAKILEEKKIETRLIYSGTELAKACDALKADAILSASITLAEANRVRITLRLHLREGNRQMKFIFTEPPATALKVAVSGIVTALGQYLPTKDGGRFLVSEVKAGSKVAVFSDAPAEALNRTAISLLQRGYTVSALGYHDFVSSDERELKLFREMTSRELSYTGLDPDLEGLDTVKLLPLDHAQRKVQKKATVYDLFLTYTRSFDAKETAALDRLRQVTKADFLLVAHSGKTTAFARGVDLRTGKLSYLRRQLVPSKEPGTAEEIVLLGLIAEIGIPPVLPDVSSVGEISPLAKTDGGEELATVAILDFFDRTGQTQFSWLQGSLSSAVNDSMQLVFEYRRAETQKEKAAASGVTGALDRQKLFAFQQATGADFLIFGDYTFDAQTQELLIEAKVYDLYAQKEIGTATERTPINGRMFNAVDNIASKIVQDIYKMATAP